MKQIRTFINVVGGLILASLVYFVIKRRLLHFPEPSWSRNGLLGMEYVIVGIVSAGLILEELIHVGKSLFLAGPHGPRPVGFKEIVNLLFTGFGSLGLLVLLFAVAAKLQVSISAK